MPLAALAGPMLDPSVGVYRIHGKALRDGIIGWVTVAGNQGTPAQTNRPSKPMKHRPTLNNRKRTLILEVSLFESGSRRVKIWGCSTAGGEDSKRRLKAPKAEPMEASSLELAML